MQAVKYPLVKEQLTVKSTVTLAEISAQIQQAAGAELWKATQFSVRITEKRKRTGRFMSTPTGMFVISVGYGADRTAVHTKKDGSFDIARVIQLLKYCQQAGLDQYARETNRANNMQIAERVAKAAVAAGTVPYITNYGTVTSTPIVTAGQSPSAKIVVGFGFTSLNETQATRALELYAQMKKELEVLA